MPVPGRLRARLPRDWRLLTLLVALFAVSNALYSAWDQGWALDERVHLAWTQRLLQGIDERQSIGRLESKTPVVLPSVLLVSGARAAGFRDESGLLFAARIPGVLWLAALLLATFHLTRRWFGETAGHLATIATALDPNVTAHASVLVVDVAYAFAVVVTLATALTFFRSPSLASGCRLGLALGLAFTAKFSAVLLLPALALLPFVDRAAGGFRKEAVKRIVAGAVAAVITATAFVCAAYLFTGVGSRLGALPFLSAPFNTLARVAPDLRLPLPAAFLTGIDGTLVRERRVWNAYVLGTFHPNGVWYYFLVLWALKTPLLVLLAEAAGLVQVLRAGLLRDSPPARFLVAAITVNLLYFSFFFHTQIGYRFVLMCVPLGYALAAAGLARLPASRAIRVAGSVVVAVALCENLQYWGNPFAFTNAAVWPKRAAWRLLADSALHYGQDRERIVRWLAARRLRTALNPAHVLPGHNTIDVNAFVGVQDEERFRWLRENLPPAGHIGYTHLWWMVDDSAYARYMDAERRLSPGTEASGLCSGDLPQYPAGERIPLSLREPPGRIRSFVACVSVRKQVDLGLKVTTGIIRFGPYRPGLVGQSPGLTDGQESWYRLEPGVHAFYVDEVPNRREWLPYKFEGLWRIRGHGAQFEVRERPRS